LPSLAADKAGIISESNTGDDRQDHEELDQGESLSPVHDAPFCPELAAFMEDVLTEPAAADLPGTKT